MADTPDRIDELDVARSTGVDATSDSTLGRYGTIAVPRMEV